MSGPVINSDDLSLLTPSPDEFLRKLVRAAHMLLPNGESSDGVPYLTEEFGLLTVREDGTIYGHDGEVHDPGEFMDAAYQQLLLALVARNRAEKHRSS